MKCIRIFSLLVIALTLGACGGNGSPDPLTPAISDTPTPTPATATAVGVANGSAVSATVGAAGGSLSAADGRLALTIPAGALAAATVIGIQPITNLAHGKIGSAYRLTPDGQTFLKPITLAFTYTDQDLLGTAAKFLGAAFQTAAGYWQWFGTATLDTAAKTVSVSSSHFTDVSPVSGLQINPLKKTVKPSATVALQVRACYPVDYNSGSGNDLVTLGNECDADLGPAGTVTVDQWSVNARLGGGGVFGAVVGNGVTATYAAPPTAPIPATVAVSARVQVIGMGGSDLVVSNITITADSWTGTATGTNEFVTTTAQVTWSLIRTDGNVGVFTPAGVVRGSVLNAPGGCAPGSFSIDPSSHTLDPDNDGLLTIDFNTTPPTYHGHGQSGWAATLSCPSYSMPLVAGGRFFGGPGEPLGMEATGVVSPDGVTIEVSQRDVLELADAWIALERQGILDVRGFAHDLMLEAALRLLPQPIKRVIHRRVADYIAPRAAPPARLAYHWLQAEDPVAALPHLVASARLAWRAGRGRETRDAFFQAAEIEVGCGQPDAAFALLFECVEAVGKLSPTAVFDEVIDRLVPLARTASHRARIALLKANSCYLHGNQPGSDRGIADALLLAIGCGDRMVQAECIYDKGCRAIAQGALRDAVAHFSACATLQRSVGLERLALGSDAGKHAALRALGQVRDVLEEQQRSLPWLTDNASPCDLATTRVEQVLNQAELGDVISADAGARVAWQAVRDTDMQGLELVRNGLSMLRFHRLRGRWDQALAVDVEIAQRIAAQGEDASELARERAGLYLDLGRPELARPYLEAFESDPAYRAPGSWHAVALRWRYHGSIGALVEPQRMLEHVLASEQFPKVCELVLAAGQCCPQQLSAPLLTPLIVGCETRGLQVYLLPLQALQEWLLARDGDLEAAWAGAQGTQATLSHADLGAALPACGLWLAKALQCMGREGEAAAVTQQATGWIKQRLVQAVPPEFHDSFRQRNPVHRELLVLAQQLRA